MVPLQVLWGGLDPAAGQRHRRWSRSSRSRSPRCPIYYFRKGAPQVDLHMALFLVIGSVVGAYVGARAAQAHPRAPAEDRGRGPAGHRRRQGGRRCRELGRRRWRSSAAWSAGLLSGTIGIGGGLVFVPIMTIGFRFAQTARAGHVAGGDRARPRWSAGSRTCARATSCVSAAVWMGVGRGGGAP